MKILSHFKQGHKDGSQLNLDSKNKLFSEKALSLTFKCHSFEQSLYRISIQVACLN